jgi:Uma2 family endonuclease
MIFKAPSLVLEVLSPTTQACDRSQKFALYRRLPSLREYVLVDPETRRVEAFRRTEQGQWVLDDMSEAAELVLPCIDARIPMAQVFEGL